MEAMKVKGLFTVFIHIDVLVLSVCLWRFFKIEKKAVMTTCEARNATEISC